MKMNMFKAAIKPFYLVAVLAFCVAGFVSPAFGAPVPPWVEPNPGSTHWWSYNFDDGLLFSPTVNDEGGNASIATDPIWGYSGSGDFPAIVGGQVGIHNVTQSSTLNIRIDMPNSYDVNNIKYVWFSYDWGGTGQQPMPSMGTTEFGHTVSAISYTANTTGNHVEGYGIIDPQPASEWLNLQLSASSGETVWVDNVTIGSSAIPEPATLAFVGIFGGGIFAVRRFFLI